MFRTLTFLLLSSALFVSAGAQTRPSITVSGTVVGGDDGSPMPGVNVVLTELADTTQMYASVSDAAGVFAVPVREMRSYRFRASFVGYRTIDSLVVVDSTAIRLGRLVLNPDVFGLDEVLVEGVQERVTMRGDTTVFNAAAYRVNPDASAEDLVTKMPGIVVQDGQVEAQGEQVRRVTVDGEEFFGNDPTLALRNLPAEIIDRVELYDRQSDQARFTGFNDGNTEKTINIVTRTGRSNGQFGKVFGGYGAEERYIGGGNVNIFQGSRRVSFIGLSNNVNQQNFAFEDLLGVLGTSGGPRGGGPPGGMRMGMAGGRPPGGGPVRFGPGGGGSFGGGGSNPRDFLVGQQGGLNSTTAVGINYTDRFGQRLRLNGSYFFNRMANTSDVLLDRQYFLSDDQSQFYSESSNAQSTNYNHRLSARIEYEIDDRNSVIVTPRLSFQSNDALSLVEGYNALETGGLLSLSESSYSRDNAGFTSSTGILWRHRFPREGRTISANFDLGLNDRWGDTDQYSANEFFGVGSSADSTLVYDQFVDNSTAGRSIALGLDYTEPIGSDGQLRVSYRPSYATNVSDRLAYVQDLQTGQYTLLDPAYSSLFDNQVVRQRAGVSYQKRVEGRFSFNVGLNYQNERLLGDQTYPVALDLDRTFQNILPEAMVSFDLGEGKDWRIYYRTNTETPSVSQLQDVIDNTNPLLLTSGNPDLQPSYGHSVFTRFRSTAPTAGRVFFGFANVSFTNRPIGTASLIAERDTVLAHGVTLLQGSQYSRPVNLDEGTVTARSFMTFGRPMSFVKSNVNFNAGVSYSKSPGLINGMLNIADTYGINGGVTVGSNISERIDFTVSYFTEYATAKNSIYPQLDVDYMRHRTGFRFTYLPFGGLVLESDLNLNAYTGLDDELYPSSLIWNAGVGYKFLRQNAGELKLILGDILNQEKGLSRNITEMYVEDTRTQVLGRYVLLNFTYRLRNFRV